jgi:hypothetical protein
MAHKEHSGTLLCQLFWMLVNEFGHLEQVVRSAIEDEKPAHYFQLAQLDLLQQALLLKPA